MFTKVINKEGSKIENNMNSIDVGKATQRMKTHACKSKSSFAKALKVKAPESAYGVLAGSTIVEEVKMLKKIKEFITSFRFGMALGVVFMVLSLFECGVQAGVTFLTGVIICYLENIIVELKRINGSKGD